MYIHIFFCLLSSLNLTEHGVIIPHLEHTPNHKGKNLLAVPGSSLFVARRISPDISDVCFPSARHHGITWYSYSIHMVSRGIIWHMVSGITWYHWHMASYWCYHCQSSHCHGTAGRMMAISMEPTLAPMVACSAADNSSDVEGSLSRGKPQTVWCWGSWADRPL